MPLAKDIRFPVMRGVLRVTDSAETTPKRQAEAPLQSGLKPSKISYFF